MTTPERRILQFATLDQIMPEVDRLIADGHITVGTWTIGQVCNHLAKTFRISAEPPKKGAPWIVRKLVGKTILRRILWTKRMAAGIKAPAILMPREAARLKDHDEVEGLRAAIRFFEEHMPEVSQHPFFDRVTRDQMTRLMCIHSAHHLSFVLPSK